MNRGKAILIAFDHLINTLTGGWPDETFFEPLLALERVRQA